MVKYKQILQSLRGPPHLTMLRY